MRQCLLIYLFQFSIFLFIFLLNYKKVIGCAPPNFIASQDPSNLNILCEFVI